MFTVYEDLMFTLESMGFEGKESRSYVETVIDEMNKCIIDVVKAVKDP
ncbi:hypothetical protein [Chitinophaga skermanii]|nr:hypothetical protein [Chitinophaga skermanii]